ncbi:MAG: hypothetical protein FWH14_03615 [Oscillospiraceae bacterium]|nr:hypothetical protein [Oscillospiraceae bacterium]
MSNNVSKEKVTEMYDSISKAMGADADSLNSGRVQEYLGKLNKNDAEKVQEVLSNPELTKKLLDSPQAKMLMKMLSERK